MSILLRILSGVAALSLAGCGAADVGQIAPAGSLVEPYTPEPYSKTTYAVAGYHAGAHKTDPLSLDAQKQQEAILLMVAAENPSNNEIEADLAGKSLRELNDREIAALAIATTRDICGLSATAQITADTPCLTAGRL
jgi:hypothetical protein